MKLIAPTVITDSSLVSSTVPEADYPVWSASTVYSSGTRVIRLGTHKVYESLTGSSSAVTITIASPSVITWVAHGKVTGTPISFTTSGTLPTGIVSGVIYYVLSTGADTMNISATVGGAAINTTGSQSGIHTATSSTNTNKIPENNLTGLTPAWLEISSTNRWKIFDQIVGSQSSASGSMTYVIKPGRVNSLAFINVSADLITVNVSESIGGASIYYRELAMTSPVAPN